MWTWIKRIALRGDALAAQLAGVQKHDCAIRLDMLAQLDPAGDWRQELGEPRVALFKRQQSGASFFRGWRSIPGTMPATSQLDWPIPITAINVASCSRAMTDLLKSFSWRR